MSTSVDHLPAFSVNPPGVLVLRRHTEDDDVWLTVVKADPHVEFSDELLTEFFNHGDNDGIYPDVQFQTCCEHKLAECRTDGGAGYNGALIRINARNRPVVYRIGKYVLERNSWRASWPD